MTQASESLALRIIALLSTRQLRKMGICRELNMDYIQISKTMASLLRSHRVIVLGRESKSPVYGLPGDTLHKPVPEEPRAHGEKAERITRGRQCMKHWPANHRGSD